MPVTETKADPLEPFSAAVRDWFERSFDGPTPAQAAGWPKISSGAHTLITAPTGSGKTLAAFLWGIDRLASEPERLGSGVRLIYVSPLKALSYDVERNLRAPLAGIGAPISIGLRTGDTPQAERQKMLRKPPDILITTPESLYLMLTSRAREILAGAEAVIVDEIHAVAGSKRGAHMALTLERLDHAIGDREVQRIALSATQRPLERIARFLVGPKRNCEIVDAGRRKELDLEILVPVEDMANPGAGVPGIADGKDPLEAVLDQDPKPNSIWPAVYPELLRLVRGHTSTIIFVNNRRAAERIALRINELAADDAGEPAVIARAHHGSLAREEREQVEELLKSGRLPCIVATSSLELGIDMGAVDLVIQVESPKSVARGLQRVGRAGHTIEAVSKGRIIPKFRGDLVESAVVAKRMREGLIEETVIPTNALDVLAQHIVSMVADDEWAIDDIQALVNATESYRELSREQLENVLDMLDGRYPSERFSELRPRVAWDRIAGTVRGRKGARQLAVANAGTIPDRGLYGVHLPDGRRVGELDEEMVYETRSGQIILLGATSWRVEEITRDRVVVTPAPGMPGVVPFWKGEGVGRPAELGRAIGEFAREAVSADPKRLATEYDLDRRAAENLVSYLTEQQTATRVVPSDQTIVVERFRDEIGDWRLCVLSPWGGRVHAAWAMAISAKVRSELGLEADAIFSDDGIVIHLPDADEPPAADIVLIEADELRDLVVSELQGSAMFGARFREAASRALLIPRAWPGKRTPLWQQRLRAQSLLEVARDFPRFPVTLEAFRECLSDVLDLASAEQLLRDLDSRRISLVEVETPTASPFASSLLFDYVATYMYEGDTPNAERRAAALALDRELLSELLGAEELRELIDPDALEGVVDVLQSRSEERRASDRDALQQILRRVGDLTDAEAAARVANGLSAATMLAKLESERRAVRVKVAGEARWIAAEDAGLYRDALGVPPPGGLPDSFLEPVEDPLRTLIQRYAATNGPFPTAWPNARYGVDVAPALRELEREGTLVRGELLPGGTEREWCDAEVLRRVRRASLAVLREEAEPADPRALARFLPAWQRVDAYRPAGAGVDRLREALIALQGQALTPQVWERDVLPRRLGAYSQSWIDELCTSGEVVWLGAGSHGSTGKVALYFREDVRIVGPPPAAAKLEAPEGELHDAIRARLESGPSFWIDLVTDLDAPAAELHTALWDLAWSGEVTNDAFAPLRAPRLRAVREPAAGSGRRFSRRRASAGQAVQGRWSLTAALLADAPPAGPKLRAQAELMLERYGIVTREAAIAEGVPGGFSMLYPELSNLEMLGTVRRGYFVEGLGGAQFALPGAVERLRELPEPEGEFLVLAATDPANPYGAALPWPKRAADEPARGGRRPSRSPGAYVLMRDGEPVLYVERGGKAILRLQPIEGDDLTEAVAQLAEAAAAGLIDKLAIERVDGDPVIGSGFEPSLLEAGFARHPRKLVAR